MKKIIIYFSFFLFISFHILKKIIHMKLLKKYKIDIVLTKPKFIRKLKVFIIIIFSGSFFKFIELYKKKLKIEKLILKNVNIISSPKKNYSLGISINYLEKIKKQNFKIYNFHLGNLNSQRGSFIFFYKFLYNWKTLSLSCHLISEKFDTGILICQKVINLKKKFCL